MVMLSSIAAATMLVAVDRLFVARPSLLLSLVEA
jgi:hypothetical protein